MGLRIAYLLMSWFSGATLTEVHNSEDAADITTLTGRMQASSDPSTARDAINQLAHALAAAPMETIGSMQAELCDVLADSDDALAIRRLSIVLSTPPCEGAIIVLANRLNSDLPPALKTALCNSIHAIAGNHAGLSRTTLRLVLGRLEEVARNRHLPGAVIDAAIMATSAFGSDGFEQLMRLNSDPSAPAKIQQVMYTALSETDDPRSLAVLRQAAANATASDSRRAQAMCGIGRLFSRAAAAGRTMEPIEASTCVVLMKAYAQDPTGARLSVSALKALSQMVDWQHDPELQQIILTALNSSRGDRREAALYVIYQSSQPPDPNTCATVYQLAESDCSDGVRAVAGAILDKDLGNWMTVDTNSK